MRNANTLCGSEASTTLQMPLYRRRLNHVYRVWHGSSGHCLRGDRSRQVACHSVFVRPLLLIWVLLTGQASACPGLWVLRDGTECPTCATEPCVSGSPLICGQETDSVIASNEKDCHSCCSLKACDDHNQGKEATRTLPLEVGIALLVCELEVFVAPSVEPRPVHLEIERGFPNAPPSSSSSRAPPSN